MKKCLLGHKASKQTSRVEKCMDHALLASQKPADLDLHYFQNRIYNLGTLRIKPLFEGIYSSDSIFAGN